MCFSHLASLLWTSVLGSSSLYPQLQPHIAGFSVGKWRLESGSWRWECKLFLAPQLDTLCFVNPPRVGKISQESLHLTQKNKSASILSAQSHSPSCPSYPGSRKSTCCLLWEYSLRTDIANSMGEEPLHWASITQAAFPKASRRTGSLNAERRKPDFSVSQGCPLLTSWF